MFFGKRRKKGPDRAPKEFGGDDFGFDEPDDPSRRGDDRSRSGTREPRDEDFGLPEEPADRQDRSAPPDRSERSDRSGRLDRSGSLGRTVDDATFVGSRTPAPASRPLAPMPAPPKAAEDEDYPDATRVIGPPVDLRTTVVAWLVAASGPSRGRDFRLGPKPTRVGSAPEAEIRLTGDPYVSTAHAEVVVEGEEVIVRDLGSTNGTYRNDDRIRDAALADGDRLRFGLSEFVFKSVRL